jgi:hypothetical protein
MVELLFKEFKMLSVNKQRQHFEDILNALELQSKVIQELSEKLKCYEFKDNKLCLVRIGDTITIDR